MSSSSTYKILLVEDNEEISALVKSSLEARNHNVTLIENGKETLNFIETIKNGDFQVVLLDIMLPGATGWEILAKIRSRDELSSLPVIMLTGMDDEGTESRALLDGADDFVTKPCSMKVLLARIEANIRKVESHGSIKFELPFSDGTFEELSEREKEIMVYLVKGYSNKEIAKQTFISELTVINHVRNIFRKLKVNNRIQAAVAAIKYKLI